MALIYATQRNRLSEFGCDAFSLTDLAKCKHRLSAKWYLIKASHTLLCWSQYVTVHWWLWYSQTPSGNNEDFVYWDSLSNVIVPKVSYRVLLFLVTQSVKECLKYFYMIIWFYNMEYSINIVVSRQDYRSCNVTSNLRRS